MSYRAFLSYSHAADGKLAPALQSALQRIAKPWYRLRGMRVFRDETTLSVTPSLWPSIRKSLDDSEYFIILASPEAAESKWVEQEVDHWLTHRPAERMLIVLTAGELRWDGSSSDFDWSRTDALPRRLRGVFPSEPLYLDLRWAKGATDLSLRNPRFLEAASRLAATLRSLPLDELIGEDVRQHELTRRLIWAAAVVMAVLTIASGFAALRSTQAKKAADLVTENAIQEAARRSEEEKRAQGRERSRRLARGAHQAIGGDRELAMLLAARAVRVEATPEATRALRRVFGGPWTPSAEFQAHQGGMVNSVQFAPDGRRLLTAGDDGTAAIRDLAGVLMVEFPGHKEPERVYWAQFGPQGEVVVTAGADGEVRLWDASNGKAKGSWQGRGTILSRDGTRLCIPVSERKVRVLDMKTGSQLGEFEEDDGLKGLSVSPDGKHLALRLFNGATSIRKLPDGGKLRSLDPDQGLVFSAEFSSDGRHLFTSGTDDSAKVWDLATGKAVFALKHRKGEVFGEFTPDGKRILTVNQGIIHIWDAKTGAPLGDTFRPGRDETSSIRLGAVSEDGEWVVTVERGEARVLATVGPEEFGVLQDRSAVSNAFSADGKLIAIGSHGGRVSLYAFEAGGSLESLLRLVDERAKRSLTKEEEARYGDGLEDR